MRCIMKGELERKRVREITAGRGNSICKGRAEPTFLEELKESQGEVEGKAREDEWNEIKLVRLTRADCARQ